MVVLIIIPRSKYKVRLKLVLCINFAVKKKILTLHAGDMQEKAIFLLIRE